MKPYRLRPTERKRKKIKMHRCTVIKSRQFYNVSAERSNRETETREKEVQKKKKTV